jgi:hypothetical protein
VGLALRSLEDDLVGPVDSIAQHDGLPHQSAVRVHVMAFFPAGAVGREVGHDLYRDAACNLAGIVAAHAICKDHQPDIRIGADRVLVVITHAAGIRDFGEVYFSTKAHLDRSTPLVPL